jgi:hypothetical protein
VGGKMIRTKTFYSDTAQERKAFARWLRKADIDRATYEDYTQCYLDSGEVEVVAEGDDED